MRSPGAEPFISVFTGPDIFGSDLIRGIGTVGQETMNGIPGAEPFILSVFTGPDIFGSDLIRGIGTVGQETINGIESSNGNVPKLHSSGMYRIKLVHSCVAWSGGWGDRVSESEW